MTFLTSTKDVSKAEKACVVGNDFISYTQKLMTLL